MKKLRLLTILYNRNKANVERLKYKNPILILKIVRLNIIKLK
jgi:hypothetical protein